MSFFSNASFTTIFPLFIPQKKCPDAVRKYLAINAENWENNKECPTRLFINLAKISSL